MMPGRQTLSLLTLATVLLNHSPLRGDEHRPPFTAEAEQRLWPFGDGSKHYRDGTGIEVYERFAPEQVTKIADNLLLYQRANGGWPKNFDPCRVLSSAERDTLIADRTKTDTTFDNRATYVPTEYLAWAYQVTGNEPYRKAAIAGLEFLLSGQYPNGGWPHTFPNTKGYYGHITIVDDVMAGILTTLTKAARKDDCFPWLDDSLAKRCQEARDRGDACLLRLQVRENGKLLGWASQYDEQTLEPAQGRTFEPPALISAESVGVLRYLMQKEQPTDEERRAIDAGVAWLKSATIHGLRIERIPAEPVRFSNHTSRDDRIAVEDPNAPPIWARFYEINTGRPVLANRDGKKVYHLAEVDRERRTGYAWYTNAPQKLIEDEYPKWKAMH